MMPLSNNLLERFDDPVDYYPLRVALCEDCQLSQLTVVIDPHLLFDHYVYRSSISQGFKDHCKRMAIDLGEKYDNINAFSFHIDIAGNDGALLNEFNKIYAYHGPCLNVDPAQNLVKINEAQGIRQFTTYWGREAVNHLETTTWPHADLITATNVFAHVHNVREFLESCKKALAPTGVIVLEFPYLLDFIERNEFDTVYFEHLSYFSIRPLVLLCNIVGLRLVNVTHQDIHGGSVRCEIRFPEYMPNTSVDYYLASEQKFGADKIETYRNWTKRIIFVIDDFRRSILKLTGDGFKVWGFAASAKGNTLLNAADIDARHIPYIVDETPEKIGKYSPGVSILIVDMAKLIQDQPDYLVILSWNFGQEIIDKCRVAGYRGRFIFPLTMTSV